MINVETYDEILEGLLRRLGESFDTSEGTLAYILASATAVRLAQMYVDLKTLEDDSYADTATGKNLDKVVALLGMERKSRSKAVVRLEGDMNFSVGDVFVSEDFSYEITLKDEKGYIAVCNTGGTEPNGYMGEVLPKKQVEGFEGMSITSIVTPGVDAEDDESLRKRYLERLKCPICMGNLAYYQEAIHSLASVGGIKVEAVNNESEEVRVIITDENHSEASEDLIKYIKNELDPEESSGLGQGLAPIGHRVRVESAVKVPVNIVVEISPESMQKELDMYARTDLNTLFRNMNKEWDKTEKTVLWDRVIEDYYLDMGAQDVNVVSINGERNRITLDINQILGGVTINGT